MKKLIVGLGNPGTKYEQTRHNVGFVLIDMLASKLQATWNTSSKFNSLVSHTTDLYLAKPLSYMNESGTVVKRLMDYYSIKNDGVLIVHDDADLPEKTYKMQFGAGAAGHHGIEDIIEKLGTKEFWRLRVGIGRPQNLENKFRIENFVLSKFDADFLSYLEQIDLKNLIDANLH